MDSYWWSYRLVWFNTTGFRFSFWRHRWLFNGVHQLKRFIEREWSISAFSLQLSVDCRVIQIPDFRGIRPLGAIFLGVLRIILNARTRWFKETSKLWTSSTQSDIYERYDCHVTLKLTNPAGKRGLGAMYDVASNFMLKGCWLIIF